MHAYVDLHTSHWMARVLDMAKYTLIGYTSQGTSRDAPTQPTAASAGAWYMIHAQEQH